LAELVGTPVRSQESAPLPLVSIDAIREAADRIRGRVVRTPLVTFTAADPAAPLWLKAETLQPSGAFKLRGAYNKILTVLDEARARGVVAHSSGNHGRAVALAARDLGLRAIVVIPETSPETKIRGVRELGATVELVPPADRDHRAIELARTEGYVYVPPYDDPAIIAGAGTVGLEIAEDLPDVDTVFVPVSGGGLISGVAAAMKALLPAARIVGVEPELAADAAESLRIGQLVEWTPDLVGRTVADGLRVQALSPLTWRHIAAHVDEIVTVSEAEIRTAVATLALKARLVAEPSGAVTLAGYLTSPAERGKRNIAVISGGNVDPAYFIEALQLG
jgi:threonine dehydratase